MIREIEFYVIKRYDFVLGYHIFFFNYFYSIKLTIYIFLNDKNKTVTGTPYGIFPHKIRQMLLHSSVFSKKKIGKCYHADSF